MDTVNEKLHMNCTAISNTVHMFLHRNEVLGKE